jgi:hypothetical protein
MVYGADNGSERSADSVCVCMYVSEKQADKAFVLGAWAFEIGALAYRYLAGVSPVNLTE